ncbi:Zinc finger BED domain-containing protein RICESLEEPER 2 [Trametes pubescens]|uniref:Zinc finger BED domain-containing protein RICESLEEPER 2 n=1 Tax=Trametes pubescens TaxID=154538 RepID=A0A1M2V3H8_TRAPU|nr:Zinc finger BED domain-containing protein RICESLEEPER 2 [Trametes pubescens]
MSIAAGKRRRDTLEIELVVVKPSVAKRTRADAPAAPADEPAAPDDAAGSGSGSRDGDELREPLIVDEAVAATAAVAQAAQQAVAAPGGLAAAAAAQKRARFLAKFPGMTPVQILDSILSKWRSKVYDHYKPPSVIAPTTPSGPHLHRFVCKSHPSIWIDRADYEDSTGNLVRHASRCDPKPTPENEAITAFANGTTYSPARMRYYLALWCARHHRPFLIVEDGELCAILRMLYGRVEIPSRVTVSRDIHMIMHHCKELVILLFAAYPGRIHICVDGWTLPNILAFLGITAHWHKDGKVRHIILDFVRLTSSHTGQYLAQKLIECLRAFGIHEKVLSVTCDNAENNTTMLREMHMLVPKFRGTCVRVRCFAHILNLVIKGILSQFGKGAAAAVNQGDEEGDDNNEEDVEAANEADNDREAADDAVIKSINDDDINIEVTPEDNALASSGITKILTLSRKVWNSPTIRAELSSLATASGLNSDVLVRSVKTRWNTVAEVLARARVMRPVLADLCDMVQFNKPRGVRLRPYILTDEEWTIIDQMHLLLDPFLFATKEISTSGRALVHQVIPYIDVLTRHVDTFAANEDLAPAVRAAARRGRLILDKYYGLTDGSIVYRIAMILHPGLKTQYFRDQDWPEEWITAAVELTRDEWTTYYKPAPVPVPAADAPAAHPNAPAVNASASRNGSGRRSAHHSWYPSTPALFASISGRNKAVLDELEAYLEAPPLSTVEDPLAYWDIVLKTSPSSPLATMAIDFLTAQATSTDSKRSFSSGRLTVSRLRHSLSDESVRTGTVLGSWCDYPEIVPEAQLVELIARRRGAHVAAPAAVPAAAVPAAAPEVIELD